MVSFSIVIPSKNEEQNIGKLLRSIRSQSIQPELIVLADASTDNTRKIANKYGVRIVQGVNNGIIGIGRNRGAKYVTSDYILFLDADTELPPNFLEGFITKASLENSASASPYIKPIERGIKGEVYYKIINILKDTWKKRKILIAEQTICLLVNKSWFEKVGGFSEKVIVGEDLHLVKKIIDKGGKHSIIPIFIKSSARRVNNQNLAQILLMILSVFGALFAIKFGWRFFQKRQRKLVKLYGKTGNPDKK